MTSPPVTTVETSTLRQIMTAALTRRSLVEEHIRWIVDGLIRASLRGIDTHGVRLFPTYLRELDGGRSQARPRIAIATAGKATATIDADHALGLVAGMTAIQEAIRIARVQGIGAVAVCNSNHFGPASCFTLEIARHDLIGISFSNTDALVAPFSGRAPLFGTNPLSLAAPGLGNDLFCVDMATSQVSYSKVRRNQENSFEIEPGWALDAEGYDIAHSGQLPVALSPLGGYKGQCLTMMVEVLCALLAGSPLAYELTPFYTEPFDAPRRVGHFFIALDIAAFQNVTVFKQRLSGLMETTRLQSPGVYAPGDIERACERHRGGGVPLEDWEFRQFRRIAADVGLKLAVAAEVAGS